MIQFQAHFFRKYEFSPFSRERKLNPFVTYRLQLKKQVSLSICCAWHYLILYCVINSSANVISRVDALLSTSKPDFFSPFLSIQFFAFIELFSRAFCFCRNHLRVNVKWLTFCHEFIYLFLFTTIKVIADVC